MNSHIRSWAEMLLGVEGWRGQFCAGRHVTYNCSLAVEQGYDLITCSECSLEEWDAYEDQYSRNVEDYVRANPRDPDAESIPPRIRSWREAFLRWGRDTLGFGLYLLRVRPGLPIR